MLDQERENIETVRVIIIKRETHKTNTEDNILKSIYKQTSLSRSESKKFLDKYTGAYWKLQNTGDGVNTYVLDLFYDLEGV